ncbi:MAG: high-affinity nickel-transport family protein [Elusimicrobia bacterium]|nr:high-affinity nickel-transport family protein [Elusimicrobiota bacterium]
MTPAMLILSIGFVLGLRHALDADHVVAVATIVSRTKRWGSSWFLGLCWGFGHTLTIFLVGLLILFFKISVSNTTQLSLEFVVAILLVFLGIGNLAGFKWSHHLLSAPGALNSLCQQVVGWWRYFRVPRHFHEHDHNEEHQHHFPFQEDGHAHSHPHEVDFSWLQSNRLRSFMVGLVHGLAGSAAVALLVLTTVPNVRLGLVYLLVFGIGTLSGMLLLSSFMGISMIWVSRRFQVEGFLSRGAGMLSLAFGLYLMYHIGFVDGLLWRRG